MLVRDAECERKSKKEKGKSGLPTRRVGEFNSKGRLWSFVRTFPVEEESFFYVPRRCRGLLCFCVLGSWSAVV
ncbi:hypothetical protein M438DRAFT_11230 [Aureobasidium pullulans EXF-150]|uniref:Uncharacterized protein n=1 Tax=Aureobasidium pullulans EXF-150 TaxID=1043002 RepID=A0A074Y173_AURPU|nr:uncharacterized protein M438DRAFT_11230 [Aureobasidium pullulans EXF-150]KEQ89654.1 hypothetical protein M438DRAFT_11230 [Aureobasidium pullulans EXF-150]